MRNLTIVLGVVLTALAVLALAPDALLASYAAAAHAILPPAIAGLAVLLLVVILLDRRVAAPPVRADAPRRDPRRVSVVLRSTLAPAGLSPRNRQPSIP